MRAETGLRAFAFVAALAAPAVAGDGRTVWDDWALPVAIALIFAFLPVVFRNFKDRLSELFNPPGDATLDYHAESGNAEDAEKDDIAELEVVYADEPPSPRATDEAWSGPGWIWCFLLSAVLFMVCRAQGGLFEQPEHAILLSLFMVLMCWLMSILPAIVIKVVAQVMKRDVTYGAAYRCTLLFFLALYTIVFAVILVGDLFTGKDI